MLSNYGYQDGSGEYFITIDTERCTGCRQCVAICPVQLFAVVADPFDPLAEREIAVVAEEHRKRLKDSCARCKPSGERLLLPCVQACEPQAITHSW